MHRKAEGESDRTGVRFRLGSDALANIRFGISPSHELNLAVRALQAPAQHPLLWGWMKAVRHRAAGPDLDLLEALIAPTGYFPDFLTGPPGGDPDPDADLAAVMDTDDDQVRRDLGKLVERRTGAARAAIEAMRAEPERTRQRAAQARRSVWQRLLAPYWEQLRGLLHADVADRSRAMAESGLAAMVVGLHESVGWHDGSVTVRLRWFGDEIDCGEGGLLLVPTVFGTPWCSVTTEPPAVPTVYYPARAVTETWHAPTSPRALDALLGTGRARVLRSLDLPRSTSEAALLCGLAVSTASHHLTVLREGGLVVSRREGAEVRHGRTPIGESLVGR